MMIYNSQLPGSVYYRVLADGRVERVLVREVGGGGGSGGGLPQDRRQTGGLIREK